MVFVRPTHLSTNRVIMREPPWADSASKPMSLLSVLLRRIVFFRGRADPSILLGYRCFSRQRIVTARIKTARSFHAPFSISLVKNTFFFSSRGLVYKSIAPGRSRNSRFAAPRNQPVIKRINLVKTNEPRVLRPLRRRFPVRTVFVPPVTLLIVVSFKLVQDSLPTVIETNFENGLFRQGKYFFLHRLPEVIDDMGKCRSVVWSSIYRSYLGAFRSQIFLARDVEFEQHERVYTGVPLSQDDWRKRSTVSLREQIFFSWSCIRSRQLRHRNPWTRTHVVNAICECKHVFLFFL